ncbi:Uncharacterized protein conserved in bacteria [Weissella viridescens]|uniref:GTP cyclohydrolase 1 type 2 homolog n=1 Tax=Weissella viridescens TaxID=1629 RepID=A0A380P216_WEIVI|nr:Uncharacterized protein conserved in bacteria [Weissella viridescens]
MQAQAQGADAFVTADVYYHTGHDMLAHHLVAIDPDHHMEANAKPRMATLVKKWQNSNGWQLTDVFHQKPILILILIFRKR